MSSQSSHKMTSVNGPFRKAGNSKRKLEDPTTSFANTSSNKSLKLRNGSSPHATSSGSHNLGNSRTAFVQNEEEEDDDDVEAGPSAPPEEDEDVDEDEEGRFFGGGVSKQERDVIDFIEQHEAGDTEEVIDISWLKRTTLSFERKINKNAELRAKHEDDPMKFVGSEADLDSEIKNLGLLAEHTALYSDFARSGCAASLVGLLAHDNTDIAISVCEVIAELTDEDTGAEEQQWNVLIKELFRAEIADLLVSNLERLDESNENDRAGVYHVLNVFENLLSDRGNSKELGRHHKLLSWLVSRLRKQDHDARGSVGQNRQYAAEILAILLQSDARSIEQLAKTDAVDSILQEISIWRKKDPDKDSDEEEFAENLFDCLVTVVRNETAVAKFIDGEGVELCVIMLKEGKFSKRSALRLLDHAAGGPSAVTICERLVDAGGLKPLYSTFMKAKKVDRVTVEHLVGLFASMLRYLPPDSAPRIRLLAKFVEKDYEKIKRLIELRSEYRTRVDSATTAFERERSARVASAEEELEDELLSRRMDAGLFCLQSIDVILAWLVAEDRGARGIIASLTQKDGGLDDIKSSLQDQLLPVREGNDDLSKQVREMLQALIDCLA